MHAVPIGIRHAHEQAVAGDAGIVDQDVDAVELALGLAGRARLTASRSARLAGEQLGAFAELAGQRLEPLDARAMQADDGALRMQNARAIASPMPPEAPVTRALRPVRSNMSCPPSVAPIPAHASVGKPGLDLGRRADRPRAASWLVDAAGKTAQHLAGTDLDQGGDAVRREPFDRLAPADAAGHLLDQPVGDLPRLGERRHGDIGHHRHRRPCRSPPRPARRASPRRPAASAPNGNGAETGSMIARLAPFASARRAAASTPALAPETTSWPPPLSLAIWQVASAAASAQTASTSACSRPRMAAMAPSPDRDGVLHGVAAHPEQARRVGQRQRSGRGKRGVFAERVAGDIGRAVGQARAARLERPQRGDRHGHQRRLGVGRQRQLLLRAFPDQRSTAARPARRRPPRTPGGLRETPSPDLAHAHALAALTRKGECDRHGGSSSWRLAAVLRHASLSCQGRDEPCIIG